MNMTHTELMVKLDFTGNNEYTYTAQQFANWMTDLLTLGEKIEVKNSRVLSKVEYYSVRHLHVEDVEEEDEYFDIYISDTRLVRLSHDDGTFMLTHADIILICTQLDLMMNNSFENWDVLKQEAS